jgi:diguanylate cyclase (GGDEF)-like protein
MISVAAAIGPSVHDDFAVLYVWTAVFAALYFPAIAASLQIAFAGIAYFVVLLVAHSSLRALVVSWTAIFGTATVLSIVVFGLVSLLRRTSREDPLTGLPNRRSWDERKDEELERARRNHTSLSLAVIDIDNFKAVNDRQGHPAGDRLLCRFADGWSETIRGSGDFVARLGGDEFGVLAPGSDDAGIQGVVERLRRVAPDGVTCTIGTATWDRVETAADMFRRADDKMYRSKRDWRTT